MRPKIQDMTKKVDSTEEKIHGIEEALSRTEHFIEKNQKIITIAVAIVVLVVLGFFAFKRFYLQPREAEAQTQVFMAEKYFEMDSLNKALNGDGSYPGFLQIIDDYSMTKTCNLAKYYAGIIYLKKGEYQNAIDYLKKFKGRDKIISSMAKGAIGDAYLELGDSESAATYYKEAAEKNPNEFTTPVFLMKLGYLYDSQKKFDQSLPLYERIQKEFPKSTEARGIEKYIARNKAMAPAK